MQIAQLFQLGDHVSAACCSLSRCGRLGNHLLGNGLLDGGVKLRLLGGGLRLLGSRFLLRLLLLRTGYSA